MVQRSLETLALKCERAPYGSDDLCRAIHEVDQRSNVNGSCKAYAYSIDDAATLVPVDCTYSVQSPSAATVYLNGSRKRWHGSGVNPALALCVAALRALAAREVAA
jgi:hypothetical protein